MKKVVFAALALLSTLTSANDLTIPGERWLGEFDGFRWDGDFFIKEH